MENYCHLHSLPIYFSQIIQSFLFNIGSRSMCITKHNSHMISNKCISIEIRKWCFYNAIQSIHFVKRTLKKEANGKECKFIASYECLDNANKDWKKQFTCYCLPIFLQIFSIQPFIMFGSIIFTLYIVIRNPNIIIICELFFSKNHFIHGMVWISYRFIIAPIFRRAFWIIRNA